MKINWFNYLKATRHFQARKFSTAILLALAPSVYAANFYVNDNSTANDVHTTAVGNNANNGTSAATPKADFSNVWSTYGPGGTNVIASGDTIFVDAGTYLATDNNLALSVDGIVIMGAGSDLSFFDNNQTSVDANRWATITGNNISIEGVYITGYNYGVGDANAIQITGVSNLTFTDVIVNENLPGGGSSSIVINGGSSVSFIGGGSSCNPGAASVAGGGVNVEGNGNTVSFLNYTMGTNEKDYEGGSALRVVGDATTTVDIDNSKFENNTNNSAEGGGAIYIADGASITIDGSCFTGNTSSKTSSVNYGGAIMVGRGSTATINNCTFSSNSATSSGNGGAIAINTGLGSTGTTGTVNLTNCAFSGNTAVDGADINGRVSFSRAAVFNVMECTWSGTAEDVTNDNSATMTLENSGSPSTSGTITFTNTTASSTTPTTNCPTALNPCFALLPVEFIDFWSDCNGPNEVILFWKTSTESNNDYFVIEKSLDGISFERETTVDGAGNSYDKTIYTHKATLESPIMYYSLTQYDYNGEFEVLKTISVSEQCSNHSLVKSATLKNDALQVTYNVENNEMVSVVLCSISGKSLIMGEYQLNPDDHTLRIQTDSQLVDGIYFVKIIGKSFKYSNKLTRFAP